MECFVGTGKQCANKDFAGATAFLRPQVPVNRQSFGYASDIWINGTKFLARKYPEKLDVCPKYWINQVRPRHRAGGK